MIIIFENVQDNIKKMFLTNYFENENNEAAGHFDQDKTERLHCKERDEERSLNNDRKNLPSGCTAAGFIQKSMWK